MHNINDLNALLHHDGYWHRDSKHGRSEIILTGVTLKAWVSAPFRAVLPRTTSVVIGAIRSLLPAQDEFASSSGADLQYDMDALTDRFESQIEAFVGTTRAYGVTPVLMTQANRFALPADDFVERKVREKWERHPGVVYEDVAKLYAMFNQRIRDKAAEMDVPLVDLADVIPAESTHLYDAVHLSDAGSRMAAASITSLLLELEASKNE